MQALMDLIPLYLLMDLLGIIAYTGMLLRMGQIAYTEPLLKPILRQTGQDRD